ncbi:MAG TPA: serine/threonine-protein kinase, partial [Thermoanaerobaculia bacterium]|nr:serine/threonine-protein kinase [Thermoanaerobaculia bacterium]
NVCRIHDLGQHRLDDSSEPLMFVSMELVDGITLGALLRERTRLSETEALPIIVQIAAGLEATHRAGIVHRDLKPANIMLTADRQRVVLMDFGLARLSAPTAGELSITETGAIVGSPVYMAPEQLEDGEVSPATDIYAFGAVIYEMVTGRRPFDGDSPISLIAQRLHGQPIPPSARWPGISPPWEQTILRCLAKRPEDRFQRARDVERALRSEMSNDVTLEIPPER